MILNAALAPDGVEDHAARENIASGIGPDGRAEYLQMNVWALARVPDTK